MKLSELEQMALMQLIERQNAVLQPLEQIRQRLLLPVQDDQQRFARMVERRLELKPGAIGTTHQINGDIGEIEPMPGQNGSVPSEAPKAWADPLDTSTTPQQ